MPPQANATLIRVTGQGTPDDWDTPAAPGGVKWNGEARAYYRESLDRIRGEGTVDVVLRRELVVDWDDVAAAGIDTDDVLTFTRDGDAAEVTATAKVIPRRVLGGVPRSLQTSRIILDDVEA